MQRSQFFKTWNLSQSLLVGEVIEVLVHWWWRSKFNGDYIGRLKFSFRRYKSLLSLWLLQWSKVGFTIPFLFSALVAVVIVYFHGNLVDLLILLFYLLTRLNGTVRMSDIYFLVFMSTSILCCLILNCWILPSFDSRLYWKVASLVHVKAPSIFRSILITITCQSNWVSLILGWSINCTCILHIELFLGSRTIIFMLTFSISSLLLEFLFRSQEVLLTLRIFTYFLLDLIQHWGWLNRLFNIL